MAFLQPPGYVAYSLHFCLRPFHFIYMYLYKCYLLSYFYLFISEGKTQLLALALGCQWEIILLHHRTIIPSFQNTGFYFCHKKYMCVCILYIYIKQWKSSTCFLWTNKQKSLKTLLRPLTTFGYFFGYFPL